jgi:transcription factor Dp-2
MSENEDPNLREEAEEEEEVEEEDEDEEEVEENEDENVNPRKRSAAESSSKADSSTIRGPLEKKRKVKSSPAGNSNGSTGGDSKANRGLRHFSMMVCKKVEEKGTTTYNEVADELVSKVIEERRQEDPDGRFDEKNIRRRVYDALNVLMAMDIISKEKKEITWKGLPRSSTNHHDLDSLDHDVAFRQSQVTRKKEALRELLVQQVCFRNLVLRNRQRGPCDEKIPLPFIVVNTNSSAVIQCDMSRDRTDVMFDFSMPFEINDDNTILKKMGM